MVMQPNIPSQNVMQPTGTQQPVTQPSSQPPPQPPSQPAATEVVVPRLSLRKYWMRKEKLKKELLKNQDRRANSKGSSHWVC